MLKISIITCTYNAAHTIERTLRSVEAQDYPHVEHLIIDGLSTDSTLRLVQEYEKGNTTSHEIRLVSEHDDGLYYAMNKGIALASGDYLLFLNAGDAFPSEATLTQVASAVNPEEPLPGVLYGDTDIVDSQGNFLRHRSLHPGDTLSWRDFKEGMLVCHQAFYALAFIARTTPYDTRYRYSADIDWCIRIMKNSEEEHRPIRRIPHILVNYLSEGLTTIHHRASLRERFIVMSRHYGTLRTTLLHLWFVLRAILRR